MIRNLGRLLAVFLSVGWTATTIAGDLTPPPTVNPTMKSLAEIDPGTPIASLPPSAAALHLISAPGRYYLTENLVGTSGLHGIEIGSDSVTIDLRGFALIGVGGSLNGVWDGYESSSIQRSAIRITNGTIRGWGGRGINLGGAVDSMFDHLVIRDNATHGVVANGPGLIEHCAVTNNGENGIQASHTRIVRNCAVRNNSGHGIYLSSGGLIEGCSVGYNNLDGIHLELGGSLVGVGRIIDCVSVFNGSRGIWCEYGANVSGCTVSNNGGGGIDAPNSLVRANVVLDNSGFNIQGAGSTLLDNHAP